MLWADNRKITDVRVRKALGYAFPYRQWAVLTGNVIGVNATPGTSLLPPGTSGRQSYSALKGAPAQTKPHGPARDESARSRVRHPSDPRDDRQ